MYKLPLELNKLIFVTITFIQLNTLINILRIAQKGMSNVNIGLGKQLTNIINTNQNFKTSQNDSVEKTAIST